MISLISRRVGGLLLVLLWACGVQAQEGKTFRFTPPEKGVGPLIYRTTLKMDQTHTSNGQEVTTTMTQTTTCEWKFEKIDAQGNLRFNAETTQLSVKLKIDPVVEYHFDSTAESADVTSKLSEALNPVYSRLAEAGTTVTISPLGEVESVEGRKELIDDLLKNNPLGAKLAGAGNDEASRLAYSDRFITFSEEPVEPGDTWETEFEVTLQSLGRFQGKRVYTYVGPDKVGDVPTDKFTVTYELSGNIDLNAEGTRVVGTLTLTDSRGTVQFDAAKGRIVSLKARYVVDGDMSISSGGTDRAITSKQTQTVERVLLGTKSEKKVPEKKVSDKKSSDKQEPDQKANNPATGEAE